MAALLYMLPLGSAWLRWDSAQNGQQVCDSLAQDSANLVILGDGRGKTSLSFQLAVSMATDNRHVTFIRPRVMSQLPLPVHGMPTPEPAALQLVKLWYPETAEEVVGWCAHLHTQALLPEVIIVDDFEAYVGQKKNPDHGIAHMVAALVDAVDWITRKSGRCSLILTASDRITSLRSVLRQFHFRFVELNRSPIDGEHNFQLKVTQPLNKTVVTADYITTGHNIMLQTVKSKALSTDSA